MQEPKEKEFVPGVSLETTGFILRFGDGHVFGSPWEHTISGVAFAGKAYLSALKGWDHRYTKNILRALASIGCKEVYYIRIKKGVERLVSLKIPEKYFNEE